MSGEAAADRERGQGTVEWIGLVLLVSLLVAAFGALAGIALPGAGLAQAIGAKLVCAVGLSGDCDGAGSELALAYGPELAGLVTDHVPDLLYERGMRELPVDYRRCREDPCSIARKASGSSSRTVDGGPATAFTRVIDCRAESIEAPEAAGVDCSGERAGKVFIQYWLYPPLPSFRLVTKLTNAAARTRLQEIAAATRSAASSSDCGNRCA